VVGFFYGDFMLVTTTNDIADKQIIQVLGIVHGLVVRTPTVRQGFMANLKAVLGGNNSALTQMCEQTREIAMQNMLKQAEALGANAIIGMRYDSDGVVRGKMTGNEVFCYGTAVIYR
jgi:uncharacterized protein YbjQ (UPF0145 family)